MRAVMSVIEEPANDSAQNVVESTQYAVAMATKIVQKLRVIDFRSYESLAAEAAVGLMMRGAAQQVFQSMSEAMRLIGSLPCLVLGELAAAGDEAVGQDDSWLDTEGASIEGEPAPPHDRVAEEVDEALARITEPAPRVEAIDPQFAASMWRVLFAQLRQARSRLQRARRARSKWGMVTEGEEGRRKALKALQCSITLAMRIAQWPQQGVAFPEDPAELQVALAVRALLVAFRRDLIGITANLDNVQNHELGIVMRDVRIRILALVLEPAYRDLRAVDRHAVQMLRARVSAWLDGIWDDHEGARRLLSDVQAFANLLQEVNRREILVIHDRRLREQCLDGLGDLAATLSVSSRDGYWRYERLLRDASALGFRSDSFHHFLEGELESTPLSGDDLIAAVETACRELAELSI